MKIGGRDRRKAKSKVENRYTKNLSETKKKPRIACVIETSVCVYMCVYVCVCVCVVNEHVLPYIDLIKFTEPGTMRVGGGGVNFKQR